LICKYLKYKRAPYLKGALSRIEAIDCMPHSCIPVKGVSIDLHNSAHRKIQYTMFPKWFAIDIFTNKKNFL